jgi:hypothetical protein
MLKFLLVVRVLHDLRMNMRKGKRNDDKHERVSEAEHRRYGSVPQRYGQLLCCGRHRQRRMNDIRIRELQLLHPT